VFALISVLLILTVMMLVILTVKLNEVAVLSVSPMLTAQFLNGEVPRWPPRLNVIPIMGGFVPILTDFLPAQFVKLTVIAVTPPEPLPVLPLKTNVFNVSMMLIVQPRHQLVLLPFKLVSSVPSMPIAIRVTGAIPTTLVR